jgi:hypothetical protein
MFARGFGSLVDDLVEHDLGNDHLEIAMSCCQEG